MARDENLEVAYKEAAEASGLGKSFLKKKGFLYAIMASSIYAFNSILGKMILVEGVEPLLLSFYQYLMGTIIILVAILLVDKDKFKITRVQLKQMAIQGIFGAFGTSLLFYLALNHLNAGIASMLLFTNPVFVTVFFAITGKKKLGKANYVALVFAMIGIVLVLDIFAVKGSEFSVMGVVFGLASALTYTFYNLYADFKMVKIDHYAVLFYTSLFGLFASWICVMGIHGAVPILSLHVLKYISIIAIFAGVLPVMFLYKSIELIGSERTSIVATLELPITLIIAFLVLKEHLNGMQIGGALLVILSVILLHRGD
ncbi:DMT family transporter [Fusibacter ferrireducens]|uniref:DMT family transporter n=1 Tax=Fusibacter ferrireducens TaxID=2785058 RepID=A0ABR9ZU68_9FIRM|nr:DMT family transporter [Fusibacter ferrireducens]MBF4693983.1 DMT family transporter [Fusibacter ferrireducens]